jgi:hypothetical protein
MVEVGEFQRLTPYCKNRGDRPIGVKTIYLTLWEVYHMARLYGLIDAVGETKYKYRTRKIFF